ncbi:MAG TPA: methylated-DNA--[protein]-cysteine S-methyltransferase [Bryobacteraceae bacterium]|jgi:methylated-DNA-[protein]-cysteine S-methyltransferase
MELLIDHLETPIGLMRIVCDDLGNLRGTDWDDHEDRLLRFLKIHYGAAAQHLKRVKNPHGLSEVMRRYFEGDITAIDALPAENNGTEFQRDVWNELRRIPAGTTISYGQLAERIGRPTAVRAVGLANGSNPVGVVVPCHRVIGSNGKLTGYGGGLPRKEWLLRHEAQYSSPLFGRSAAATGT